MNNVVLGQKTEFAAVEHFILLTRMVCRGKTNVGGYRCTRAPGLGGGCGCIVSERQTHGADGNLGAAR
jgi:hypothetical protein